MANINFEVGAELEFLNRVFVATVSKKPSNWNGHETTEYCFIFMPKEESIPGGMKIGDVINEFKHIGDADTIGDKINNGIDEMNTVMDDENKSLAIDNATISVDQAFICIKKINVNNPNELQKDEKVPDVTVDYVFRLNVDFGEGILGKVHSINLKSINFAIWDCERYPQIRDMINVCTIEDLDNLAK